MQEILSDREKIGEAIYGQVKEATDAWGVQVERVEVKDVRLPKQMQRAMAAEAEATREARAKVVGAEGEQKAAKALREASDIMGESSAALQLRYLQTLTHISAEKNSTIVFPLPMDLVGNLLGGGRKEVEGRRWREGGRRKEVEKEDVQSRSQSPNIFLHPSPVGLMRCWVTLLSALTRLLSFSSNSLCLAPESHGSS